MGAEEHRIIAVADEECVLHLAGRVFRREVESLEYMPVVLDLRTFSNIIAELAEDVHDLLARNRHRMTRTELYRIAGHCIVK